MAQDSAEVTRGLDNMTTEQLEAEVQTISAQLAAATCRFLALVAELDRRKAWAAWGCKSMAHWISWRCALGLNAAREHVRVASALTSLPETRASFANGQLSYSKVRAVTRVATPEVEKDLVEFAHVATASQLERSLRSYRDIVAVPTPTPSVHRSRRARRGSTTTTTVRPRSPSA
jgi:hypothetical protein